MRKKRALIFTLSTLASIILLLQCMVHLALANPVGDFIQPKHTIAELDGYLSYDGEPVDTFYIYCSHGIGIKHIEMEAALVNDIYFTLKVDWDGDGDWEVDEVVDLAITIPWYWEMTNPSNASEKISLNLWYRSVGGTFMLSDKFGLLAPYIGLASTVVAATVATALYVRSAKRRKDK